MNKENWEILVVDLPKEAVPHGFSSLKLVVFLYFALENLKFVFFLMFTNFQEEREASGATP